MNTITPEHPPALLAAWAAHNGWPLDDERMERCHISENFRAFKAGYDARGAVSDERLRNDYVLCSGCGGHHPFDTSIESLRWNAVVRADDYPETLCLSCIVRVFARAGQAFTGELFGGDFAEATKVSFSLVGATGGQSEAAVDCIEKTQKLIDATIAALGVPPSDAETAKH